MTSEQQVPCHVYSLHVAANALTLYALRARHGRGMKTAVQMSKFICSCALFLNSAVKSESTLLPLPAAAAFAQKKYPPP